jgi:hypothetical protein
VKHWLKHTLTVCLTTICTKDLLQIVGDQMEENLTSYTDEELISEVESYYPDLLEDS